MVFNGFLLDFISVVVWFSFGFPRVFPWISMVFNCFLMDFNGFLMDFNWFLTVFLWIFIKKTKYISKSNKRHGCASFFAFICISLPSPRSCFAFLDYKIQWFLFFWIFWGTQGWPAVRESGKLASPGSPQNATNPTNAKTNVFYKLKRQNNSWAYAIKYNKMQKKQSSNGFQWFSIVF